MKHYLYYPIANPDIVDSIINTKFALIHTVTYFVSDYMLDAFDCGRDMLLKLNKDTYFIELMEKSNVEFGDESPIIVKHEYIDDPTIQGIKGQWGLYKCIK